MENLKELRIKTGLSQLEAAERFGVSLRSYRDYENNISKRNNIKYKYMVNEFEKMLYIDEETGLLTLDSIRSKCTEIFERYDVKFCFLFGSYAKGKETPKSDVDLLIDTSVSGIQFLGLIETLRVSLHKKIDLLEIKQLMNNEELLREILKDGIKIYG